MLSQSDLEKSLEEKRQRAVEYLRSKGIYRADTQCKHTFDHVVVMPAPRSDFSPNMAPQRVIED